jgi:hypothetical protein
LVVKLDHVVVTGRLGADDDSVVMDELLPMQVTVIELRASQVEADVLIDRPILDLHRVKRRLRDRNHLVLVGRREDLLVRLRGQDVNRSSLLPHAARPRGCVETDWVVRAPMDGLPKRFRTPTDGGFEHRGHCAIVGAA